MSDDRRLATITKAIRDAAWKHGSTLRSEEVARKAAVEILAALDQGEPEVEKCCFPVSAHPECPWHGHLVRTPNTEKEDE